MSTDVVGMGTVGGLAFALWAIVALYLFVRLPPAQATLWTFLGAHMLLPTGFYKAPILPPIDKTLIPTVCAAIGIWILSPHRQKSRSEFGLASGLLLLYVTAPVLSALSNTDTLVFGNLVLPGAGLYDGLAAAEQAIFTVLPFVFGRRVLRTPQHSEDVLRALRTAGLIYSLPMLFEIRFSPQLHYWVYGFASSDFVQEMRDDGFRPMVFMGHGLVASFFVVMSLVAAAALWRTRTPTRLPVNAGVATSYLGILLVLCKSLGSAFYGLVAVPLVCMASPKTVARVAVLLSIFVIAYPLLRTEGMVPTESILSIAGLVNDDRGRSLEFRFVNEDRLLNRANERILTGWGRFGRNRVFDENGRDVSVTDGRWIIVLGAYGIVGFIAEFALLTYGVFRTLGALKYVRSGRDAIHLAAISLILSLNMLDLIPNATLTPLTFLLAGALVGQAEHLAAMRRPRPRLVRVGPAEPNPAIAN